ncbi:MAG: hypothetical protein ACYTGG_07080 [Planctomycetota bacterium]|jgi:hypothetical protein
MTMLKQIAVRTIAVAAERTDDAEQPSLRLVLAAVALGMLASTLLG